MKKNKEQKTEKKVCTRCGKLKPINQFYKNKYSSSGVFNECKRCILTKPLSKTTDN